MQTTTPRLLFGLVLFVLSGIVASVRADEWRGFRGLDREAANESATSVAEWAPDKNVRWKIEIPGKGHSSPVVSQDSVYLTSAFLSETRLPSKTFLRYSVYALSVFLGGAALIAIIHSSGSQSMPQFWSLVLFCFLMGIAFSKLVAAQVYTDENDVWTSFSRWVLTGCVSTLFLVLAGILFARKPWVRLLLGIMGLAFSALMLLDRPEQEYYVIFDRQGNLGYFGMGILKSSAVPAIAAGLLILAAIMGMIWHPRTEDVAELPRSKGRPLLRIIVPAGAICLGVLMPLYAFRILQFIRSGEVIEASLAVTAKRYLFLGMCAYLAVGALALLPRSRVGSSRLATWLGIGFVCAAVGVFVERNYVLPRTEFVRAIICVDRATGEVKWTSRALGGPQLRTDRINSPASPTALIDGERVYAYFGSAGLMCTDHDGNLLWTKNDLPFEGIHGVGGSPILSDGVLVISSDGGALAYVAGIDAKTGQQIWRHDVNSGQIGTRGNYRTPHLKSNGGRTEVLIWGWRDLRSFDLHSGEPRWTFDTEDETHEPVASLVSDANHLFLAARNSITGLSLPLCRSGEDAIAWEIRGRGSDTASPVRVGDLLFVVSAQGIASCLDTTSGKRLWRERLAKGSYLASLVATGDHVYAFNSDGLATVFAADRQFRKIAENHLDEEVYATPAPVDGQLFIRTTSNLWCLEAH